MARQVRIQFAGAVYHCMVRGNCREPIVKDGGITQFVPKGRSKGINDLKRSMMYDPATLGLKSQDIADLATWLQTYR